MPVLAIDQGTTSTRALVVDDEGKVAITHAIAHRQHYPGPGRVEHDPSELVANVRRAIDENPGIDAIGIDNQGESCLAWNADTGEPVSPVIVWQDNRTGPAVERLATDGAGELVMARAGLPLDSYFSASKLAWILDNLQEAARLGRIGKLRLGTTDAFFLDRLTGRHVTDITTASRTSLMNLETGQWDPELCALFGVPPELLPEIVPTTGDFGRVTSNGREIPVTASVVDQQASLYGHGCRRRGDAKITFGTGAFALAVSGESPVRAPELGLLPTVAWQKAGQAPQYALDGGVYNAGSAVDWARSLGLFDDYASINAFDGASAAARDLVFVPALSGLACPHWDRRAGGMWIGLTLDTGREDMVRALIEGVAFRAAEVIRAMTLFIDIGEAISIDGGMANNPYFCRFLATVLERRVLVRSSSELTAMGTAALAGAVIAEHATNDETTVYQPQGDTRELIERFDRAVARARSWRS